MSSETIFYSCYVNHFSKQGAILVQFQIPEQTGHEWRLSKEVQPGGFARLKECVARVPNNTLVDKILLHVYVLYLKGSLTGDFLTGTCTINFGMITLPQVIITSTIFGIL